jgi:hypothetical protein
VDKTLTYTGKIKVEAGAWSPKARYFSNSAALARRRPAFSDNGAIFMKHRFQQ